MKKLTKINDGSVFFGVCAGIGKKTKINPWLFRILFLFPILGALAYLLFIILLPEEGQTKSEFLTSPKNFFKSFFKLWVPFKNRFSKSMGSVEENVNFPVSHIFWHFVTYVGILGGIAGLVLVLWGITPVFKDSVDEPTMLTQRAITAGEVQDCVIQKKPKQQVKKTRTVTRTVNNQVVEEEVEVDPPVVSLAKLQEALPEMRFSQQGRKNICEHSEGHHEYGDWGDWVYPSRCYELGDVDTKVAKEIRDRLQRWFPYDSASQQYTVDQIANHLMRYEKGSRKAIYKGSIQWIARSESVESEVALWTEIDKVLGNVDVPSVTVAPEKVLDQFNDFLENNKINGRTILVKALSVVALAGGSDRLQAFKTARAAYRSFDLDAEEWSKATDQFVGMNELHSINDYIYNLECFYNLYWQESSDRIAENSRRKAQYESDLVQAEFDAAKRKAAKRSLIPTGGIMIGIGAAAFIVIAILLMMFSMQRTLIRMEDVIREMKSK